MKFRLLVGALALTAANARAAPPTAESVEALLEATHVESTLNTMYGLFEQSMRQGMQQYLQGRTLTADQQRLMDALPAKFVAVMSEEFNWPKMKPQYVQLYRETFEQEEIDGLVAFYKSPAGQAFINKMPASCRSRSPCRRRR